MEVEGWLFTDGLLWSANVLCVLLLLLAAWRVRWSRLGDSEQLHVFLGSCVVLMLLWSVRTDIAPGLDFHLLGITSVTLMFGWGLTVIATSIALIGINMVAGEGWDSFGLNVLINGALPAALTQVILVVVRSVLPKHFFIYVFVNAFFAAGLVALCTGLVVTALLLGTAFYSAGLPQPDYVQFFPLMFFPEAFLNGWIMTMMVGLRPSWVVSFDDDQYLRGK